MNWGCPKSSSPPSFLRFVRSFPAVIPSAAEESPRTCTGPLAATDDGGLRGDSSASCARASRPPVGMTAVKGFW
ncbi:MAG: hypothetical protein LBO71_05455 [Prevotellaceae bacterium]|nr:hypothetical protein [Prevotellaceae bacterium]